MEHMEHAAAAAAEAEAEAVERRASDMLAAHMREMRRMEEHEQQERERRHHHEEEMRRQQQQQEEQEHQQRFRQQEEMLMQLEAAERAFRQEEQLQMRLMEEEVRGEGIRFEEGAPHPRHPAEEEWLRGTGTLRDRPSGQHSSTRAAFGRRGGMDGYNGDGGGGAFQEVHSFQP